MVVLPSTASAHPWNLLISVAVILDKYKSWDRIRKQLSLSGLLYLSRWLIKNKFILRVLEDGTYKIKVLGNLVSDEKW